jgi:uncharacterized protein YjiS (DUF1127 family)
MFPRSGTGPSHVYRRNGGTLPSRRGARLLRGLVGVVQELRRRVRDRSELADLDTRMLRDIGLTEAERDRLLRKPLWRK